MYIFILFLVRCSTLYNYTFLNTQSKITLYKLLHMSINSVCVKQCVREMLTGMANAHPTLTISQGHLLRYFLCERPVSQWQIKWLHLCLEACTCGTALFPLWRLRNYHKVLKVTVNQLINDHLQGLLKIINIIIENWLWWTWSFAWAPTEFSLTSIKL